MKNIKVMQCVLLFEKLSNLFSFYHEDKVVNSEVKCGQPQGNIIRLYFKK